MNSKKPKVCKGSKAKFDLSLRNFTQSSTADSPNQQKNMEDLTRSCSRGSSGTATGLPLADDAVFDDLSELRNFLT
jgi:hypothetical protein